LPGDNGWPSLRSTAGIQVLGEIEDNSNYLDSKLLSPFTPEYAALHADNQMITAVAMEQLYNQTTMDINKFVTDTTTVFQRTAD
jgi:hypothetical protein